MVACLVDTQIIFHVHCTGKPGTEKWELNQSIASVAPESLRAANPKMSSNMADWQLLRQTHPQSFPVY